MRTLLKITELSHETIGRCLTRTEFKIESYQPIDSETLSSLRKLGFLGSGQMFQFSSMNDAKPIQIDGSWVYIARVVRECDSSG